MAERDSVNLVMTMGMDSRLRGNDRWSRMTGEGVSIIPVRPQTIFSIWHKREQGFCICQRVCSSPSAAAVSW